jgi:hypothetical protein
MQGDDRTFEASTSWQKMRLDPRFLIAGLCRVCVPARTSSGRRAASAMTSDDSRVCEHEV